MIVMHQSHASDFLMCPRLYRYRHVDGRVPRRISKKLQYGLLGHSVIEARSKGEKMPSTDSYPALDEYDIAGFRVIIAGYFARWSNHYEVVVEFVEKSFSVEITPWLRLDGRVDIAYRDGGALLMLGDHKFTAEDIGPQGSIQKRLRLDKQISLYLLASVKLKWGARHFVYDMIRKPGAPLKVTANPQYTKEKKCSKCPGAECDKCGGTGTVPSRLYAGQRDKDESTQEYAERIAGEIKAEPDRWYGREVISRTMNDLDAARDDLIDVGRLVRAGAFPRNDKACNRMFGERCAYYEVCTNSARLDDDTIFMDKETQCHESTI